MKRTDLDYLACPFCKNPLVIISEMCDASGEIEKGQMRCEKCLSKFPIKNYIPRFVPPDNYSASFGIQWHIHSKTQIDKFNGTSISKDRFFDETKWAPAEIKGKLILEAGCGAGRFTQIALDTGATCFSIDYSSAVEVCRSNNNAHPNLHLFQSDINHLSFKENTFDKIFCFGVLQHTPTPAKTFMSLIPYLKSGGEIAIDVYAAPIAWLHPRHLLRLFTVHIQKNTLYGLIKAVTPYLLPVSKLAYQVPLAGPVLARAVPVANYQWIASLNDKDLLELAILDTFDWLSPRYERPQTLNAVKEWFARAGLKNTSFRRIRALYVGKGIKK